jgi:hypothetical protein
MNWIKANKFVVTFTCCTAATVATLLVRYLRKDNENNENNENKQEINPWEVRGAVINGKIQAIDYDKLIEDFGTMPIDAKLKQRFEDLTGKKCHTLLRRGIFFSHRYFLYVSKLRNILNIIRLTEMI